MGCTFFDVIPFARWPWRPMSRNDRTPSDLEPGPHRAHMVASRQQGCTPLTSIISAQSIAELQALARHAQSTLPPYQWRFPLHSDDRTYTTQPYTTARRLGYHPNHFN